VGTAAQAVILTRDESALVARQLQLCEQITGQKTDSTTRCLALIQERIQGTAGFQVPEVSAADVFLEISRRLPYASELKRKVTELDITSERVRLKGTTVSYDAIDTMVQRLQGGRCFEMNITINLDCAKAPGDGKLPPPPPGPSAEQLRSATAARPAPVTPSITPSTSTTPTTATSPPPAATPYDSGGDVVEPKRPLPADLEERKERLRKLREEREQRRQQLGNPLQRQTIRDRFQKPAAVAGDDGDN
jgi:hypothetical protein